MFHRERYRFHVFLAMLLIVILISCGTESTTILTPPVTITPNFTTITISPSPQPLEPPTLTPFATQSLPTTVIQKTLAPTPFPTAIPPIVMAVIGDYGLAGPDEEAVADLVNSWRPDVIITTGDNNYPDGEAATIDDNIGQYYSAYIHPYQGKYGPGAEQNRFFPSLGNHDWNPGNIDPYLYYFNLPGNERYYDVRLESVHLFIVDSDSRETDGVSANSVQAQWLNSSLKASDAQWKLVIMHHSPYSSGQHGSIEWMRWPYAEWGADAVLAGHDHLYERLVINGLPYFVNGLGGSPNRYVFLLPHPGSAVRFRDEHGAMRLQATPQELLFEFITIGGEIVDTYRLTNSN